MWLLRYRLLLQPIICILWRLQTEGWGQCLGDKSHQGITWREGPLRPPRNYTLARVLTADKADGVERVTGG